MRQREPRVGALAPRHEDAVAVERQPFEVKPVLFPVRSGRPVDALHVDVAALLDREIPAELPVGRDENASSDHVGRERVDALFAVLL